MLIGDPHLRQRPRNSAQLSTGTLSNHRSSYPHPLHREGGVTTDVPRGSR